MTIRIGEKQEIRLSRTVSSTVASPRAGQRMQGAGTPLSLAALLARSAWFPQLPADVQDAVLQSVQVCVLAPGAALILHGDTALHWHGVLEGLLKWSATTADGRSVTLAGLTVGSWFGEGSLLHGRPVQADIVALRPSRVALLPQDTFDWLHRTQPSFSHFLLQQLNERLHWFMGDFIAHRLYRAEALVARALLGLQHPWLHPGSDGHLQITQDEVAALAGLSRQRCNRALNTLRETGVLRIEYGGITVLDAGLLARAASEP